MRYPHLAPIGEFSVLASASWKAAGHDLETASTLASDELRFARQDGWNWLQLFEILRRGGNIADARIALRESKLRVRRDVRLEAACELAAGLLQWWTPDALRRYQKVEVLGRRMEDDLCIGIALVGQARCSRFTGSDLQSHLIDEALDLLADDRCGSADAWREAAAHALLNDRKDVAFSLAAKAYEVHQEVGDQVLGCYALLLQGRVERDRGGDRFGALRTAYSRAVEIGAHDVAADVALYLVPALARGKSPESTDWHEAVELAEKTFTSKSRYDAFGAAEVDLQLANLKLLGDVNESEKHAFAALVYFSKISNELGVGNAWKALARCHMRRAQIIWQGRRIRGAIAAPKNLSRGLAYYTRSRTAYLKSGFDRLAHRVSIEIALVKSYELGLPIDEAVLASLQLDQSSDDVFSACKSALLDGISSLEKSPSRAVRRFELASQLAERVGSGQLSAVAFSALARAHQQLGNSKNRPRQRQGSLTMRKRFAFRSLHRKHRWTLPMQPESRIASSFRLLWLHRTQNSRCGY